MDESPDISYEERDALRSAKVVGWGSVETMARSWDEGAVVEEVEPRMWRVRAASGRPLGVIVKDPWTKEEAERRAAAWAAEGEKAS